MKLRFFVIPILVLFTLLQPLRSFLFHQDVGVLSSIEWAMDMDNDTEQEEKKKDQESYEKIKAKSLSDTVYYRGFTEDCLKDWYAKPDMVFTVTDSALKFTRNYHTGCFSRICAQYVGPYPP